RGPAGREEGRPRDRMPRRVPRPAEPARPGTARLAGPPAPGTSREKGVSPAAPLDPPRSGAARAPAQCRAPAPAARPRCPRRVRVPAQDLFHPILDLEFLLLDVDRLHPLHVVEDRLALKLLQAGLAGGVLRRQLAKFLIGLGKGSLQVLVGVHHRTDLLLY